MVKIIQRPVEPIHYRPTDFLHRRIVVVAQPQKQITRRDERLRTNRHHQILPFFRSCQLFSIRTSFRDCSVSELTPNPAEHQVIPRLCEASRAPSASDLSLAQTTSSATRPIPAEVSKPQSVP